MICLKHAWCKLSQLTGASLNDEVALFVQPDTTRAGNLDANATGLCTSRESQIVFQPSGMTIKRRIDAVIQIADAGLGE